jgi:thioredoxin 1
MPFLPLKVFACQMLIAAALIAGIPGCQKPKEPAAAAPEPALLPVIATTADVKVAASKAGSRMIVIDFYADWCKPCRILAPVMRELATENKSSADFYRANVDGNAELSQAFGIRGIPYVVFMKNDTVVYALTGLRPKALYVNVLAACAEATSAADCMTRLKEQP